MSRPENTGPDSHAEVPHSLGVRDLLRERGQLAETLHAQEQPGHKIRRAVSELTILRLGEHYDSVAWDAEGLALAAIGSVGRLEAGPYSDLDLVLLHDGSPAAQARASQVASELWYPLWDAGIQLDHSTRSLTECRQVANRDLVAAAGLIDLQPVGGDANLVVAARSAVLQDWRSAARRRLPDLLTASRIRAERFGELAYVLEPHLKEARGGLRDFQSLAALAATWLTDRPHGKVDVAGNFLYDVRDATHAAAGRASYVLGRHLAPDVAEKLGFDGVDELAAALAEAGRTVAFALDNTERGARRALDRTRVGSRGFLARRRGAPPRHVVVAPGLIDVDGELALAPKYEAAADAVLPLRAAAVAAHTGLKFTPGLLETFADCRELPNPWPGEALDNLQSLLRGSNHLVAVWEAMDLAGQWSRWLPEWQAVRNRPQRNPFHVYTVDRHMIEAVSIAGKRKRQSPELDLVLLATWLHDIGKRPGADDHSRAGAELIPTIAARLGLEPQLASDLETLVLHHLTLAELATTKDPSAPTTIDQLLTALGHREEMLEALRALTEADSRAAGPKAWTAWRESLVDTLTANARAALQEPRKVG